MAESWLRHTESLFFSGYHHHTRPKKKVSRDNDDDNDDNDDDDDLSMDYHLHLFSLLKPPESTTKVDEDYQSEITHT